MDKLNLTSAALSEPVEAGHFRARLCTHVSREIWVGRARETGTGLGRQDEARLSGMLESFTM